MPDPARGPRPPLRPQDFERVVLVNVLAAHPASLTIAELRREFETDDRIHRPLDPEPLIAAVDRLHTAGLVHRDRALISATAAAVRMGQLLGGTV
jgi:hypothetical protein